MKIRVYPQCAFQCNILRQCIAERNSAKQLADEVQCYKANLESLITLPQKMQIIALRQNGNMLDVVAFDDYTISDAHIWQINPDHRTIQNCGTMYLSDAGDNTVILEDWNITAQHDKGYGTYFLSSVIEYLKRKHYKRLIGIIAPTDFDHEDKLRHIYQKMGFEIEDCGNHRRISCCLSTTPEKENRSDVSTWLIALESLQDSDIAERIGLSRQDFLSMSSNSLFQRMVLDAATEIGKQFISLIRNADSE